MADVAAIERATLAAVPPRAQQELHGWLLAFDEGSVGRAHSAVPLAHVPPAEGVLGDIERAYAAHGLAAVLRFPRTETFAALRAQLGARGYVPSKPTLTQLATVDAMALVGEPAGVELADAPDTDWASVFLGEGFDAKEGEGRLDILRRSPHNRFASFRLHGRVAAVGAGCFLNGWCGVHGLRTAPGSRGKGLAARLLSAFAQEAQRRSTSRALLQVEEPNTAARSLYRRAGFETAWAYDYWKRC